MHCLPFERGLSPTQGTLVWLVPRVDGEEVPAATPLRPRSPPLPARQEQVPIPSPAAIETERIPEQPTNVGMEAVGGDATQQLEVPHAAAVDDTSEMMREQLEQAAFREHIREVDAARRGAVLRAEVAQLRHEAALLRQEVAVRRGHQDVAMREVDKAAEEMGEQKAHFLALAKSGYLPVSNLAPVPIDEDSATEFEELLQLCTVNRASAHSARVFRAWIQVCWQKVEEIQRHARLYGLIRALTGWQNIVVTGNCTFLTPHDELHH